MHEQADEHSLQTIANKALLRLLGYPAHTLYALFCCSAAVELEPQQSFSQYLHQLVHLQKFWNKLYPCTRKGQISSLVRHWMPFR